MSLIGRLYTSYPGKTLWSTYSHQTSIGVSPCCGTLRRVILRFTGTVWASSPGRLNGFDRYRLSFRPVRRRFCRGLVTEDLDNQSDGAAGEEEQVYLISWKPADECGEVWWTGDPLR